MCYIHCLYGIGFSVESREPWTTHSCCWVQLGFSIVPFHLCVIILLSPNPTPSIYLFSGLCDRSNAVQRDTLNNADVVKQVRIIQKHGKHYQLPDLTQRLCFSEFEFEKN